MCFFVSPSAKVFIEQGINSSLTVPGITKTTMDLSDLGQTRPLAELLWRLAFSASEDPQAITQCRREDVIKLSRYPNLTRLPRTPNAIRIAILLTSRATSSVLAAKILKIDESEVIQFYFTSMAAGYLTIVSKLVKEQAPAEVTPVRSGGMLSKIIDHIVFKSRENRQAKSGDTASHP